MLYEQGFFEITDLKSFFRGLFVPCKQLWNMEGRSVYGQFFFFLFSSRSVGKKHAHLLFEGGRFGIFRHHIVQGLDGDVDDAAELVLDHTDDEETTQTQYSIQFLKRCMCK